jgi:HlyD family secretion protein
MLSRAVALAIIVGAGVAGWRTLRSSALDATEPGSAPLPVSVRAETSDGAIIALGRLEPKDGVMQIAGPSQPTVFMNVVSELYVQEGDRVRAGQIIAVFGTHAAKQAEIARLRAERAEAQREDRRLQRLYTQGVVSVAERDQQHTKLDVVKAQLEAAEAELELTVVRAPLSGRVLKIHAHQGERVAMDGIAEIGNTDEMYAVAEVYESDIGRVRVGQRASVTSRAFSGEIQGTVEHIGWKIGKMDVLNTDPAAKTDARVVEVKIRLDDSTRVAQLTNLQVDVRITP